MVTEKMAEETMEREESRKPVLICAGVGPCTHNVMYTAHVHAVCTVNAGRGHVHVISVHAQYVHQYCRPARPRAGWVSYRGGFLSALLRRRLGQPGFLILPVSYFRGFAVHQ